MNEPSSAKPRGRVLPAFVLAVLVGLAGAWWWRNRTPDGPARWGIEVVASFPHDTGAYTQGLLFHAGHLYESTGRNGTSSVRQVELETGSVLLQSRLPSSYFAEGLALAGDKLYQLTWKASLVRVYELATLRLVEQFRYTGEGWGLTYDGTHLVQSDGSHSLRFRDPSSFEEVRSLVVQDRGFTVDNLNELEYVEGEIWANVWKADTIVRIDPGSGDVLGWIDIEPLVELVPPETFRDPEAVLNGIAYDPETERLFLTGKLWPTLFEVEIER